MAPGARSKFGSPSSNLTSFGSKYTLLKKVVVTLLGLFGALRNHSALPAVIWRPGICAPLAPLVTPLVAKHLHFECGWLELFIWLKIYTIFFFVRILACDFSILFSGFHKMYKLWKSLIICNMFASCFPCYDPLTI